MTAAPRGSGPCRATRVGPSLRVTVRGALAPPSDSLEGVLHTLRFQRWTAQLLVAAAIAVSSAPLLSRALATPPSRLALYGLAITLAVPVLIAALLTATTRRTFILWAAAYLELGTVVAWQRLIDAPVKLVFVLGFTLFVLWRTQKLVNAVRQRDRLSAPPAPPPGR